MIYEGRLKLQDREEVLRALLLKRRYWGYCCPEFSREDIGICASAWTSWQWGWEEHDLG